jgi:hypothetical protein
MNFPIALEAYGAIEETDELNPDLLLARKVVHNEVEANEFLKTYSSNKNKIVTRSLTAEELSDPKIN